MPPLTSESMNIFKNSSVAFAVSIPELTQFYLQAGEETSAQIPIYIGVIALYVISAMLVNRILTFIERKVRVPGFVAAGGTGGH
ncbi:ABC-type amino acid transport system%2C permease component [Mycobacterium tuberculosis]|nr:ABC-type amino acid transport system%2C permease component [Mycobacterium tuberculosis]